MTIQQLIQEHKTRLCSTNPAERLTAALLIPGFLSKQVRRLPSAQLRQLLEDEVWSNLNLLAPESTICLAAVYRLRRGVNNSLECKSLRIRGRARRSWTAERNKGVHILNTEIALHRAGIPFLQLPWQLNRFASGTFLVTDVAEARSCLMQRGFRETPQSHTVLIDSQTRQPIQLFEYKHNPARGKS